MPDNRVFSAPSLLEVLKYLTTYRSTGVLSLWRANDSRQEEFKITIDSGRPLFISRGSYIEQANETTLAWLDNWGQIHFTFQPSQTLLQLPAPQSQSNTSSIPPRRPQAFAPSQLNTKNTNPQIPAFPQLPATNNEDGNTASQQAETLQAIPPEKVLPLLTPIGHSFPVSNLPRKDRTIFLLINGRRTLADLTHLTNRSNAEIYASLLRLQGQQLITIKI